MTRSRCAPNPMFNPGLNHHPLGEDSDLACTASSSRLENAAPTKDIYRIAQAFVDHFIAGYAPPPELIVLDIDHSEDGTHGQWELSFVQCKLPVNPAFARKTEDKTRRQNNSFCYSRRHGDNGQKEQV